LLHHRFTPMALATQFIRAFSLDYGLDYGGHYFTDQNTKILLDALKLYAEDIQELRIQPTIQGLLAHLTTLSNLNQNKDARHIQNCLQFMAEYPQVNSACHAAPYERQIDMNVVLDKPDVVYFFLEMADETIPLRQIAGLALFSVLEAAK